MNVKVEAYLAEQQRQEAARRQAERERILKEAGFVQKIYSPYEQASQEYPLYDEEELRYYKLVFEELTQEEYELIAAYASKEQKQEKQEGLFADAGRKMQSVAGFICWGGIALSALTALVLLAQSSDLFLTALLTGIVGAVGSWLTGLLLYGFGELILKVTQIEKNTRA